MCFNDFFSRNGGSRITWEMKISDTLDMEEGDTTKHQDLGGTNNQ